MTNGYSDLILELYGPEVGMHARSSIGMMLPLNAPVNCEAEVEIDGALEPNPEGTANHRRLPHVSFFRIEGEPVFAVVLGRTGITPEWRAVTRISGRTGCG